MAVPCPCCERRIGTSATSCGCDRSYCVACLLCDTHCVCSRFDPPSGLKDGHAVPDPVDEE